MTRLVEPSMNERLRAIEDDELGPEFFTAQRIDTAALLMAADFKPAPPPDDTHPLESGVITDAWVEQTVDIEQHRTRIEKRRGVLLTLANQARMKAQSIRSAATPRILARYQRELDRLLTDVRDISDHLGDVDTAAKAITADVSPLWKQLAAIADDYAALRLAQMDRVDADVKFASGPEIPGDQTASDLYIANLDQIWPAWRRGGNGNQINLGRPGSAERHEPWPADPAEFMLWLVRSDAQPWIPNHHQLEKLRQDRIAAANPLPATASPQQNKRAWKRPPVEVTHLGRTN